MAMDVKEIRFYVLDVGQGACNYVEIVNSAGVVIHNMLVDLGTNSSFAIGEANIAWLTAQIEGRADPRVDVVMLTHGDTDHYNLMSRLLPALDPPAQTRISMVRWGGPAWRYKVSKDIDPGRSLINALKLYSADVNPFLPLASSYAPPPTNTWTPIWPPPPYDAGDPRLFLILANAPHPQDGTLKPTVKRQNAEAVNSKSLVFGIWWKDTWFVGTGDATAATMGSVNAVLGASEVPGTMMLTLPHHGSRKTTYDLKKADNIPGDHAKQVVEDFLVKFDPWTVSISADEKRHHHPSLFMVNQFALHTNLEYIYWQDPTREDGGHYLVPWIDWNVPAPGHTKWPGKWQYGTVMTGTNVYSTLYFDAGKQSDWEVPTLPGTQEDASMEDEDMDEDVPRGRDWVFTNTNGNLTVNSRENQHPQQTRRMVFTGPPAAVPPARNAAARLAAPPAAAERCGAARPAASVSAGRLAGLKPVA